MQAKLEELRKHRSIVLFAKGLNHFPGTCDEWLSKINREIGELELKYKERYEPPVSKFFVFEKAPTGAVTHDSFNDVDEAVDYLDNSSRDLFIREYVLKK